MNSLKNDELFKSTIKRLSKELKLSEIPDKYFKYLNVDEAYDSDYPLKMWISLEHGVFFVQGFRDYGKDIKIKYVNDSGDIIETSYNLYDYENDDNLILRLADYAIVIDYDNLIDEYGSEDIKNIRKERKSGTAITKNDIKYRNLEIIEHNRMRYLNKMLTKYNSIENHIDILHDVTKKVFSKFALNKIQMLPIIADFYSSLVDNDKSESDKKLKNILNDNINDNIFFNKKFKSEYDAQFQEVSNMLRDLILNLKSSDITYVFKLLWKIYNYMEDVPDSWILLYHYDYYRSHTEFDFGHLLNVYNKSEYYESKYIEQLDDIKKIIKS